jgi:NitT/TauT family transport system ATP-binding protein
VAHPSWDKTLRTLPQPVEDGRRSEQHAPIAALDGVSVVFGNRKSHQPPTLDDISVAIYPEGLVALIGPSGCGKSTTMRLLCGLAQPTSGTVKVGPTSTASRGGISVMFQTPALLDWRSVLRNVTLPLETRGVGKDEARERASVMLDLVGLGALKERRPYELSGGQQQRVALARALVTDPDLLLLDEPFGALDAITRDRMCEELQAICADRRMATVLVTHSVSEAIFLADRILVMQAHPGRITEEIHVSLARPRSLGDRTMREAKELEAHLLSLLIPH